jgi:hypothetical protein
MKAGEAPPKEKTEGQQGAVENTAEKRSSMSQLELEKNKSMSELESEMIGNIATVFAGEEANPSKFIQRMHRSIRRCIQNCISDAVKLVLLELVPPPTKQRVNAPTMDATTDAATEDATTNDATDDAPTDAHATADNGNLEDRLKSLLSNHFTRRNRTLVVKRDDGRDTLVVSRPFTRTPQSFVDEANRSNWLTEMLPDTSHVNGVCMCPASKCPKNCDEVGQIHSLQIQKRIETSKTLAIASEVGLGETQLEKLRSWMRAEGVILELSSKEVNKINEEVGIRPETEPVFGTCENFEDGREPQLCQFHNTRLDEDICLEIESHLFKPLSKQRGEEVADVPSIDHCAPSNKKGMTILLGGDHGQRHFRFHAKIHLTSPQEGKDRGELAHQCPMVQITCCDCAKDKHLVLKATVVPRMAKDIAKVRESCATIVCDASDIGEGPRKACLVPKSIRTESAAFFDGGRMQFCVDGKPDPVIIDFLPDSPTTRVQLWNLRVKRVASNFCDFCIGDIAFLATVLGMESSEACHCLLRASGTDQFNCDLEDCMSKQRTVQNMCACLLKCLHKSRTSTSLKNVDGVNNFPLVPADFTKVIVPILHCPMGLVDKLLTSFLDHVWQKVLLLPPEDDLVQKRLLETDVQLGSLTELLQSKKVACDESKTPENKEEVGRVQAEKNKAGEKEQLQTKHMRK